MQGSLAPDPQTKKNTVGPVTLVVRGFCSWTLVLNFHPNPHRELCSHPFCTDLGDKEFVRRERHRNHVKAGPAQLFSKPLSLQN